MATIELITADEAPLLAKPYFADGPPSPIVAALAHVPEFLEVAMPFIGTVLGDSSIPERLKEIIVLRLSVVHGCTYCTQAHTVAAWDAGLTGAEVAALREEAPIPETFDPRERALIAFSDALRSDPASAPLLLRPYFETYQIVELVTVGSLTIMLTKFATALGLPTSAATATRLSEEGALAT